MGSASRQAMATSLSVLNGITAVGSTVGEQLLVAARTVESSAQLRSLLADPGVEPAAKQRLTARLFPSIDADAKSVLDTAVAQRWSTGDEFADGIEELGYRAIVRATKDSETLQRELFAFEQAVASDAGLELAVGSKLASVEAKAALVDRLLVRATPQTRTIVSHLVARTGTRRFGDALRRAERIVADQVERGVAVVRTAFALTGEQLDRLERTLTTRYGRAFSINQVLDPSLIGGLRISVGDDVIDGSVATRLNDLRLQLAG
jgi:F-type H+-transporting ATPase subunit delta